MLLAALVATIPEDKRYACVEGFKRTQNLKRTAREVGVSPSAARRWVGRCAHTRRCEPAARPGRPRALTEEQEDRALELALSEGCPGAGWVGVQLYTQGVTPQPVEPRTALRAVRRAAARAGFTIKFRRGHPRRKLSADNKRARLAFAQANLGRDWSSVMFTDRKKFYWRYPGQAVPAHRWVRAGEAWEAAFPTHPKAVNVYCGLTVHGCCPMHVVAGTSGERSEHLTLRGQPARGITRSEYRVVLMRTLCPGGQRLLGPGPWLLQQDNDPTHKLAPATVKTFNRAHNTSIRVMPNWPPNSPDFNLIENVWSIVQVRLNLRACSTFPQFKQAVREELAALREHEVSHLFSSLKARLQEAIDKGGDRTRY